MASLLRPRPYGRRPRAVVPQCKQVCAVLVLLTSAAGGQTLLAPRQHLDFDRPEAWAMKYTAAVVRFTSLAPVEPGVPGRLEFALEGATVPSLSTAERRIGFNGTKVEDIDRAPAFGRLRLRLGLPRGFAAELGVVPPLELDGVEPLFVAAALSRPLIDRRGLTVGGRVTAQYGTVSGDITCSRDTVSAGADVIRNPFGCEEASDDELALALAGLELVAAPSPGRSPRFRPYAALGLQRVDGEFEVDARYSGIRDLSTLTTEGWTWSLAVGASGGVGTAWRWSGELYYSPLSIRRPGRSTTDESVVNLRFLVAHTIG